MTKHHKLLSGLFDDTSKLYYTLLYSKQYNIISNPLMPRTFYIFKWFSIHKQSIGFYDSVFGVTMKSAAVLKHWRLKFSGNVTLM